MYPEFQLREEHFVVVDVHSDLVKAGPADPFSFPTVEIQTNVASDRASEEGGPAIENRRFLCGASLQSALSENPLAWNVESPFKDGFISDWARFEALCAHVLFNELNIKKSRNHSPVLLSIPTIWSRSDRERLVQLFFEKLNVPGLYVADQSLMALYGYGQHLSGMAINISYDRIDIVPILDTAVNYHAVVSLPMGFRDVAAYAKEILERDTQFLREYTQPVTDELLEFLLKHICEVSPLPLEQESTKGNKQREIARIPVEFLGKKFSIGEVRHRAYECLFTPKTIHKRIPGLTEAILLSLERCESEKRLTLMENVVPCGLHCTVIGLLERLEKDMDRILPRSDFVSDIQVREIKFGKVPDYIEKYKSRYGDVTAWMGGAVVAKHVFPDMKNFITKLDYNEHGPYALQSKGY